MLVHRSMGRCCGDGERRRVSLSIPRFGIDPEHKDCTSNANKDAGIEEQSLTQHHGRAPVFTSRISVGLIRTRGVLLFHPRGPVMVLRRCGAAISSSARLPLVMIAPATKPNEAPSERSP